MKKNKKTIIFIRHADTQKDPEIIARDWTLSEKGFEQANKLASNPDLFSIQHFFVSSEQKTRLTILPLSEKLKRSKTITTEENFDEVKRGNKFLSKEEFELEKKLQLENLDYRAYDGESCNETLIRFKEGINNILLNKEEIIAVVSHGTILNCYFADILNYNNQLPKRWSKTPFACYGIVEYRQYQSEDTKEIVTEIKVLKDIISNNL